MPGTRLPPFPITRLADWQSVDLQSLAPSDGLWKLIAFVDRNVDLKPFKERIQGEKGEAGLMGRLTVSAVIDASVEEVHWRDVPEGLMQWER